VLADQSCSVAKPQGQFKVKLGELNYDVPRINDVCAQDLVAEAYKELMERQDLKEEYGRVAAIAQRWGY
jgi:hypothetical protein